MIHGTRLFESIIARQALGADFCNTIGPYLPKALRARENVAPLSNDLTKPILVPLFGEISVKKSSLFRWEAQQPSC